MSIKKINILFNIEIKKKKLDYKTYVGTTTIKKSRLKSVCNEDNFSTKKIELRLKSVKLK